MSYEPGDNQQPPRGGGNRPTPPMPPQRGLRTGLIWLLLIGLAVILFVMFTGQEDGNVETLPVKFEQMLRDHPEAFRTVYIRDGVIHAELREDYPTEGPRKYEIKLEYPELVAQHYSALKEQLAPYEGVFKGNEGESTQWGRYLISFLPWLLILGVIYFFLIRQLRGGGMGGGMLNFGKTRARLIKRESSKITFEDVAGMVEAKQDVGEIIDFLRNPKKFQRIGGRIPRGVLFIGPPGTGKTLLAKAIAGEADVPFFSISGSDFVEMFVGVGASRVRDLFRQAKESSPCIIFLDEIDAVGRKRGTGFSGAHDEREQTLNAILVEMDGFDTNDQVITIAATNRPDVLDPALRRPGRFDREVTIGLPDIKEREAILKVHVKGVKTVENLDLSRIARGTPGFSGADLSALVNEAALAATMFDKDAIDTADMEEARDKVRWGRSRRSHALDEQDKRVSAYHEAGHALLTVLLQPDVEPLHKVTIIPRGAALGATMFLPERDRYLIRRKECLGSIMVSFGGRIVEQMIFNDISSGASNDIKQASALARRMIKDWGMSSKIGPIHYSDGDDDEPTSMFGSNRAYSDDTAREIDEEIRQTIDDCYSQACKLLEDNRDKLDRLAEALLAFEVLDAEEVKRVLAGKPLERTPEGTGKSTASPTDNVPPAEREPTGEPGSTELRPREPESGGE